METHFFLNSACLVALAGLFLTEIPGKNDQAKLTPTASHVSAKLPNPELVTSHFNNILEVVETNNYKNAALELQKTFCLLTFKTSDVHAERNDMHDIIYNLEDRYIEAALNMDISMSSLKSTFERAHIILAHEYMLSAGTAIRKHDFLRSGSDIKNAKECLAMAMQYGSNISIEKNKELLNNCERLLKKVNELDTRRASISWVTKIKNLDNKLEGPVVL